MDLEGLAGLLKAIAHPNRLAILNLLKGRELTVYEIMETLNLRQAYVSQQLTILREEGLVCYRREGWNIWYRIAQPDIYNLLDIAQKLHANKGTCAVAPEECLRGKCYRRFQRCKESEVSE